MPTTTVEIPTTTAQKTTTTAQMPYSQVCKVDLSKFPQYYFLLENDASEHTLVMYSLVFTTILPILFIVAKFLQIGWYAFFFYFICTTMATTAWAGFIKLIIAVNNYQKVSKILKIYNNPNTIGNCNVIFSKDSLTGDSNSSKKIFMGSKDAIGYIQFSTVLLIILYTIITPGFVVLAILSLFKG